MIGQFARDEVDFFLAQLPAEPGDFNVIDMAQVDLIVTAARRVLHELAGNSDAEAVALRDLAAAADAAAWHPGELEALEGYWAAWQAWSSFGGRPPGGPVSS